MRIKKIIFLAVSLIFILNVFTFASGVTQNIAVEFNSVNITVNDEPVYAGNILYNGTTYIPLRAISTMLGCSVDWNGATSTAIINKKDDSEKSKNTLSAFRYFEKLDRFYICANAYVQLLDYADKEILTLSYLEESPDNEYTSHETYYQRLSKLYSEIEKLYNGILADKNVIYDYTDKINAEASYNLTYGISDAYDELALINETIKVYMDEEEKLLYDNEILKKTDIIKESVYLSSMARNKAYAEFEKTLE